MKYAYFIGCIMLASIWLLFFIIRKDLRKEMIFGSLLGMPFGLSEFLFVPEYWDPPSIFDLIQKIGFGIESLLFGFLAAGIAAIIFEVLEKRKVVKIKSDSKTHIFPYALIALLFVILELLFPIKSIYNLIFSLFIGSLYMSYKRRDLLTQIIISGIFFSILYFLLFFIFNKMFPTYIPTIYNLKNFWGVVIFNVPIEETIFAFAVGSCWSVLYEFIKGYKTIKTIG